MFLLLAVGGLQSCGEKKPPKTKEQVMEERLAERLEAWETGLRDKCLRDIFERANVIVDSAIIANARLNRDTAGGPLIPLRPDRPTFVAPQDTTPVKPFLKTQIDTIGN